jgi:hypothetical protein
MSGRKDGRVGITALHGQIKIARYKNYPTCG